ncbi:MAG: sulfatase family protein [Phycisphaerales bacterium]
MIRSWLVVVALAIATVPVRASAQAEGAVQEAAARPNIVLIYADDIGFGDVSCNGGATIATPNIDRIVRGGLRFTDAHCTAATCTPSRYSLLTGEYAFRRKGTGVLPGDATLITEPGRPTLPSVLRTVGYHTAVVGKWHLGLGTGQPVDWNGKISPGPLEVGFDRCFLVPATGDRVPCVYVRDHGVVGLVPEDPIAVSYRERIGDAPVGKEVPDTLKMRWDFGHDGTIVNGISRIGFMTGGEGARWVDEDMADVLTTEAVSYIDERAGREAPFFLYFATHDIHVPRVPHARFVGRSGMGPRGDAIVQLDDCVGRLLGALDRHGLAQNTLVIFTSDNGPVINDGYRDRSVELLGAHKASGPFRGGKYSSFEGGTRVPLLVRWPGHVAEGVSTALVSQIDLFASIAALVDAPLPEGAAPDSVDHRRALLGADPVGRRELVAQAGTISLREGSLKFIPASDRASFDAATRTELGNAREDQLYDLSVDPGETRNLAAERPETVARMRDALARIRSEARAPVPRG